MCFKEILEFAKSAQCSHLHMSPHFLQYILDRSDISEKKVCEIQDGRSFEMHVNSFARNMAK